MPPQGQEQKFPGRNPQAFFSKARNPPCFQGGSELAYKEHPPKKPPLCRSRAGDHTSASSQFNERGQTSFSSTQERPELSRYPRTRMRLPAKRCFGYAIPASSSRVRAYLEEGLSQSFEGGFPFFSVLFLTQDAQGCAVVCQRHKKRGELLPCRPWGLPRALLGFLMARSEKMEK